MILSVLLVIFILITFFLIKSKIWDGMSSITQRITIFLMSLLLSLLFVIEFFIYLNDRILNFIRAIESIPLVIVLLVFAIALIVIYKILSFVGDFDVKTFLQHYKNIYDEVLKPEIQEVKQKLKGKFSLNPFKRFRKTKSDSSREIVESEEEDTHADSSKY